MKRLHYKTKRGIDVWPWPSGAKPIGLAKVGALGLGERLLLFARRADLPLILCQKPLHKEQRLNIIRQRKGKGEKAQNRVEKPSERQPTGWHTS